MDKVGRSRLVRVLARAYDHRATAQSILEQVGLAWADGAPIEGWRAAVEQAAEEGLLTDLLAAVITDPSAAAFYPMLRDLLDIETLPVLAVAVRRYGLPGSTPVLESLRENVARAETVVPDETVDGLQAITSPPAGFGEPLVWAQAFVNASQRIARIEVNGRASGTGLLVGPDLLLTAAHVLDRSAWPPRETPTVTAIFDYVPTPHRSESETGLRIQVTQFLCGSLPSEAEAFNRAVLEDPPPDCLDFALLRLARDVAAPDPDNDRPARGYYRLDPNPYSFDDAGLLFIPQHPLGMFQKISYIDQAPKVTPSGVRVRYRSNTLQGSSGSPVIDISGNLVAIHHYYAAGKNQGVPTAKIAEAIVRAGFGSAINNAGGGAAGGDRPAPVAETPVPDPFLVSQLLQAPMVNREPLRAVLRQMAVDPGGRRTLIITGERGAGISISHRLLTWVASRSRVYRALAEAAPGGMGVVPIDLRTYRTVPVADRLTCIVRDLTIGIGLRRVDEPIAQDARNVVTLSHWIRAELSGADKQWWIFFDSVDDATAVRQGSIDELIYALLDLSYDFTVPLRVVVGGRDAEQIAENALTRSGRDEAYGIPRADAERWLTARLTEQGRPVDQQRLADEMSALFPEGRPDPTADLVAASLPVVLARLRKGNP